MVDNGEAFSKIPFVSKTMVENLEDKKLRILKE